MVSLIQSVLGHLTEALLAILLPLCTEVILLLELSACTWVLSLVCSDALTWVMLLIYFIYKKAQLLQIHPAAHTVFSKLHVASISLKEIRNLDLKRMQITEMSLLVITVFLSLPLPPFKLFIYGFGL